MPVTRCLDLDVHWESAGAGAPLVLISGLGGDSSFWAGDVTVLSQSVRTITYDARGTGDTANPAGDYTVTQLADDLAALLDALDVDRADVLGFSMGGVVAQEFALRHSERVDRLILAATFATANPQAGAFLDGVLNVYAALRRPGQMFDLIYPWLFSLDFQRDPDNAAWWNYDDADEKQTFDDWRRQYEAQRAFDATDRLGEVTAPTLVIAGENDRLADLSDARLLADRIPDAELHVVPGSGHLINVEAPDLFHRLILDFLG